MQRYFALQDSDISNVLLSEQDVFHISKVMRNKVGDEIEVVIASKSYLALIASFNPFRIEILKEKTEDSELKVNTRLFFPLTKMDKIELVIQKATELGIKEIYLYNSSRCIVKLDNESFNKKRNRLMMIAKEASEQCHRLSIPEIKGVISFKDIPQYNNELNLLAYEVDAGKTNRLEDLLNNSKKSISYIVGPEGGFSSEEVEYLTNSGYLRVPLGKRILRCETAAIYLSTVISYYLEKE